MEGGLAAGFCSFLSPLRGRLVHAQLAGDEDAIDRDALASLQKSTRSPGQALRAIQKSLGTFDPAENALRIFLQLEKSGFAPHIPREV